MGYYLDRYDSYQYLVSYLNLVLNLLYPVICQAADVHQTLLAGLELYLCAYGQYVHYLAQEHAADFYIAADIVYHAPVAAIMPFMVFPPDPITSRILSGCMLNCMMRGA